LASGIDEVAEEFRRDIMSTNDDLTQDDPRVIQAAREYLAELESGRTPDRKAYLKRHPEVAVALEDALDGIDMAQQLRPTPVTPPVAELIREPLGDFKIIRELGRGGMGVVYEAMQLSLGRRVALKVLPFAAALDPKHLQRFKTEAHAAAQLHHTNIVPVYAVGCERGVHFYAMQIIDGRPLDRVIRQMRESAERGTAPTVDQKAAATVDTSSPKSTSNRERYRTVAGMITQAAEALDYAHESGIVHRDMKPANLLLESNGKVWVTDFGLAQIVADVSLTQSGDLIGTLRYMSPEQASGKKSLIDHRTDVYSLGATLYELLTLEPIFSGTDRQALLTQILNDEPRPLRQLERTIPVELETICLKALGKVPTERYNSAGEMAADLRRYLAELPIQAKRPSLVERLRKWGRRHPGIVGTAIVSLIISVIGLSISTGLVLREKGRTDAAFVKEQERAREAEERFQLAQRSADSLIRFANQNLAENPQHQTLRRELLELAVAYYQELIELRQNDPNAQAELQATRDRVTALLSDLVVMQGAWRYMLLLDEAVQNDVVLDNDQKQTLSEWWTNQPFARPDRFEGFHHLNAQERQQRFVDQAKANETAIGKILWPRQMTRLQQIALQARGISAFNDPEIIAALKLTDEQKEKIRTLDPEMFMFGGGGMRPPMPKFGGPGGGPGGPPKFEDFDGHKKEDFGWPPKKPDDFGKEPKKKGGEFGPKKGFGPPPDDKFGPKKDGFGPPDDKFGPKRGPGSSSSSEVMEKALLILTAEQRAKWKVLVGEPFAGFRDGRPFGGPKGPPPDKRGGF
jgi:serine/threonine protein kinase